MPDQPKADEPKSTSDAKPGAKASAASTPKAEGEKPPAPKASGDVTSVQLTKGKEPAPPPAKPPSPPPPDADVTTLKKAHDAGEKRGGGCESDDK